MTIMDDLENNFLKSNKNREIMVKDKSIHNLLGDLFYGKVIEIYGTESSGKSTFLYYLISQIEGNCLFIDTEFSFDREYVKKYIDLSNIIVCQENNPDKLQIIIDNMIKIGVINIICIDSLTGINYQDFVQVEKFFFKILILAKQKDFLIILTNQMRTNIMTRKIIAFGSKKIKKNYFIRLETKKNKVRNGFEIQVKKNQNIVNEGIVIDVKS